MENGKLTVLSKMREIKSTLFGEFSATLTKQIKDSAWLDVAEEARALGIVKPSISVDYFRQVTWQNWRRRTLVRKM